VGIGFNLATDVFHVRVDGAVERVAILPANGIEQLAARKHTAGVSSQRRHQLEFRRGQVKCMPASRGGHSVQVEREVANSEQLTSGA
jgi:hypothetical protein